jgi:sporulation protein YlmC with PRC-barrel domain
MLKRHIAYCMVLTALTAAPAMAQTKPDTQAGGTKFITQQSPDQWRGSKLIGVKVVSPSGKSIGSISEVLVDHSGNAQAVVIGVGGFLGIGAKNVAVPFNSLKWVSHEEAAKAVASNAKGQPGSTSKLYNYAPLANQPPIAGVGGGMARSTAPAAKPATDASLGYPDHAVVSMTEDQLKKAPDFHYAGASMATKPPTAK